MKKSIYKAIISASLILILVGLTSFGLLKIGTKNETKTVNTGFVVLELFTSQGCSSCPPADEVLANYAIQNNPNIIPLAFHVDYWNYLGWKDPFSKSQFTERQRNYSSQLKAQGNYTPQIVINGKHELVGSYKNEINNLVNKELKLESNFNVSINKAVVSNNELNVECNSDALPNTVVNLALVKKKEFTSIKRGENMGLKQTNYSIVFDFKTIQNTQRLNNKASFIYKSDWLTSDFLIVAYIQNIKTGQIIAATKSIIN